MKCVGSIIDLTGLKFGKLTVVSFSDIKNGNSRWLCRCDCGNEVKVFGFNLKTGNTTSCGCAENTGNKKYNEYDLNNKYGIGYTTNTNKFFYFDKEDYNKIKDYCWIENDQGYIIAHNICGSSPKSIRLHRLILNISDNSILIDHKNMLKEDCRKDNLRIANKQTNGINRPANKNNKLGVKGVSYIEDKNKFSAKICVNGRTINLGIFDTIKEAKEARQLAGVKYFGEFAYID